MRTAQTLLALCLLLSGAARATDQTELVGFTPDGNVAVFLVHGVADGSGFPWARGTFMDVKGNRALGAPVEVELQDSSATEEQAVAKAKAALEAARLEKKLPKLVPGKQIKNEQGELYEQAGPPIGTVEIKLKKPGKRAAGAECPPPFAPRLLAVKLLWMGDENATTLLADKAVPAERACLSGCALGKVFASGKSALFLLDCKAPGFEGPGSKVVPIAAKLKYGLDEELPGSPPAQ